MPFEPHTDTLVSICGLADFGVLYGGRLHHNRRLGIHTTHLFAEWLCPVFHAAFSTLSRKTASLFMRSSNYEVIRNASTID